MPEDLLQEHKNNKSILCVTYHHCTTSYNSQDLEAIQKLNAQREMNESRNVVCMCVFKCVLHSQQKTTSYIRKCEIFSFATILKNTISKIYQKRAK